MILDTSYTNKANNELINDLVGRPYSIFEKLKLRGVGSKRMIIEQASPNFKPFLNSNSNINYANLELRPKGLLIRFNKGLQTFTWIIPFYHLTLFKINGSSIHAQGKFIHFKNNITFKENKNFFKKLIDRKLQFDKQYNFNL
ncbi:hypothetical protein NO995_09870 [Aestuariibaculum sp. M13]|uniref:hypothetical protein n=1 Tax=Aestuariibaculum sp. M13 TaxID=2967132 RepID=UPI002159F97D|nr:hypothetical protein [Aestuariibaculum sp. M13]MCR8667988.1 hypothetical protein [Aestuariibaculum sp. M13]